MLPAMHPHRNTSIWLCELSLEEASDITSKEFEMEVVVTNRLHPAKRVDLDQTPFHRISVSFYVYMVTLRFSHGR